MKAQINKDDPEQMQLWEELYLANQGFLPDFINEVTGKDFQNFMNRPDEKKE